MEPTKSESAPVAAGSSNKHGIHLLRESAYSRAVDLAGSLQSDDPDVYLKSVEELRDLIHLRDRVDPDGILYDDAPQGLGLGAGLICGLILAGIAWLFYAHVNVSWKP